MVKLSYSQKKYCVKVRRVKGYVQNSSLFHIVTRNQKLFTRLFGSLLLSILFIKLILSKLIIPISDYLAEIVTPKIQTIYFYLAGVILLTWLIKLLFEKSKKSIWFYLITFYALILYAIIRFFYDKIHYVNVFKNIHTSDFIFALVMSPVIFITEQIYFDRLRRKKTTIKNNIIQEDVTSKKDKLGVLGFAKVIDSILHENVNDVYVIGIDAPYGHGKTNFLELLLKKHEKNCINFFFNPWEFKTNQSIEERFFNQLSKKLKDVDRNISNNINNYLNQLIRHNGKMIYNILPETIFPEVSLDDIVKSISEHHQKMIIVIDDLDRLNKDEVHTVFKLIRNIRKLKSTYIIVCYHKENLRKVLGIESTDLNPLIRKIINSEFIFPEHNKLYNLKSYLSDEITNKIQNQFDIEQKNQIKKEIDALIGWNKLEELNEFVVLDHGFHKYIESFDPIRFYVYFETPREINSFISFLAALYATNRHDVNFIDYLYITILKYKYKSSFLTLKDLVFKHIASKPAINSQIEIPDGSFEKDEEPIIKFLLRQDREDDFNKAFRNLNNIQVYFNDYRHEHELSNQEFNDIIKLGIIPIKLNNKIPDIKEKLLFNVHFLFGDKDLANWLKLLTNIFEINEHNLDYKNKFELIFNSLQNKEEWVLYISQNISSIPKKISLYQIIKIENLPDNLSKIVFNDIQNLIDTPEKFDKNFDSSFSNLMLHSNLKDNFLQLLSQENANKLIGKIVEFTDSDFDFKISLHEYINNLTLSDSDYQIIHNFILLDPQTKEIIGDHNLLHGSLIIPKQINISSLNYTPKEGEIQWIEYSPTPFRMNPDNPWSVKLFKNNIFASSIGFTTFTTHNARTGGNYEFNIHLKLPTSNEIIESADFYFQVDDFLTLIVNDQKITDMLRSFDDATVVSIKDYIVPGVNNIKCIVNNRAMPGTGSPRNNPYGIMFKLDIDMNNTKIYEAFEQILYN